MAISIGPAGNKTVDRAQFMRYSRSLHMPDHQPQDPGENSLWAATAIAAPACERLRLWDADGRQVMDGMQSVAVFG